MTRVYFERWVLLQGANANMYQMYSADDFVVLVTDILHSFFFNSRIVSLYLALHTREKMVILL